MSTISRRGWLAGAAAAVAGLGGWPRSACAAVASEERAVAGFDSVQWDATGELTIAQASRERLTVEAEPAVLAKVVTQVRGRRLHIGFAPGPVQTRQAIRFKLELRTLSALETRGSGTVRIGPLSVPALALRLAGSEDLRLDRLEARRLEVRLEGAGEIAIGGGRVERQLVVIAGSGRYAAPGLASREAEAAIEGSGEIRLAVADRLHARIAGSGDVLYHGQPRLTQVVTGAGEVRRGDGG